MSCLPGFSESISPCTGKVAEALVSTGTMVRSSSSTQPPSATDHLLLLSRESGSFRCLTRCNSRSYGGLVGRRDFTGLDLPPSSTDAKFFPPCITPKEKTSQGESGGSTSGPLARELRGVAPYIPLRGRRWSASALARNTIPTHKSMQWTSLPDVESVRTLRILEAGCRPGLSQTAQG